MRSKVAVLGLGSWGTAFGNVVADADASDVVIWGRRPEIVEAVNTRHENPEYFPGMALNPRLRATTDVAEALRDTDVVVLAVPSQTLRDNLRSWRTHLGPHTLLVSLMKGVERGTLLRMSQVIADEARVPATRVAVVSGPNLAGEIMARQPATTLVACSDEDAAVQLQHLFKAAYFRPYTDTDIVGAELGGAVKNVIALAVGVAVGMGLGDNAKAALITRGLAETVRLAVAMGADEHTLSGLAGMGDLVATCNSPLSRNRTFGELLGSGLSLDEATAETRQTVEGVKSAESILAMAADHGVEMPITETVVAMMFHGLPSAEALTRFMSRTAKPERYGV